jgi:hypothetical protein
VIYKVNQKTIGIVLIILAVVIGGYLMMNRGSEQTAVDETTESALPVDEETTLMEAVEEGARQTVVIDLLAVDEDTTNQFGTAELMEVDGQTQVIISVNTASIDTPQPAHIHQGVCPGIGAIAYPLTNVVDGESTTMIDVSLEDLMAQSPLAINLHRSAEEISVYTSCGDIAAL